jgi:uncharacterized protein YbaP (TraB family)
LADTVMAPYRVSSMAAYRPALKTIFRALVLLALLLWVIGSAAPMAGLAQTLPGSSKTCLWEIPAEGGGVFLLGSIHFMRAEDYPLPPAMDAAYAVCRAVVFETDIGLMQDPRVQTRMLELGMLPAGRSVFDTIGPETRRRLEAKLAETGLPVEIVAGFRPWMIALTLSALEFQRLGFDPNLGVDMHFFNKANADGKRIAALETVEFQLQLLAGMNAAAEEAFLALTIQDLAQAPEVASAMVGLWRSGDAPGLQQLLFKTIDRHPDVRDRMLAQRNRAWAGKIADLIRQGEPALVIVGAMHLIGPGSVVELLQARGYRVEQR